jgi:hypothetical protein
VDALGQRATGLRTGGTDGVDCFIVAEQEDLRALDLYGVDLVVSQAA